MESFLHAVSSVTMVLLLTATGYVCAAKHWLGHETKAFISKFLMTIVVPCMCIYSLLNNLDKDLLAQSGRFLLIPFVCNSVGFLVSFLLAHLLRMPRSRIGVFMVMCSLSNAVFIGLGMCTELFGEVCTPYVMLYYLVNTSFLQILGVSLIRWSGEGGGLSRKMLKKFITAPTVLSVFLGITLVLLDCQLPSLVMTYCRYMNNLVTPLALVLTGYIIYEIGLRNLRLDRDLGIVMAFRFLLVPALSIALCSVFGVTGLGRDVLAVESAMPVVTQTVVAATEYGADEQFAAQGAAISTLACFVVIPVLMLLL